MKYIDVHERVFVVHGSRVLIPYALSEKAIAKLSVDIKYFWF
jgi:hypothetical protein